MATTFGDLDDAGRGRFADAGRERSRWYWADGRLLLRVDGVVAVAGGPGGPQLLLDRDGVSHWVAPGYDRVEVVGADGRASASDVGGDGAPAGGGVGGDLDATSEAWREYALADGTTARFEDPLAVRVAPDGSHLVWAVGAPPATVGAGFLAVRWQARHGRPHFAR